ncbi:prephenate/arogenate dehydrogenase family protein [Oleispirillum naphthae]|uniref:prephenate/arogenate dehydrogenase family protein n=1 Tax=Oleispirillum naphthae TaxID=2838853 RepID=UPI00308262A0
MSATSPQPMFGTVAFIGIGLIGASLALAMKRHGMAGRILAAARRQETLDTALRLGIADDASTDIADVVKDADLVMVCTPVGVCGEVARAIAPFLKPGAIVSDVGSVKGAVIRDMKAALPPSVAFVPGHPLAGTEFSGPEAGFAELFEGRWCVLTPLPETPRAAVEIVAEMWRKAGSNVDTMDPEHHDQVLAITSHLPHLIAYTIVGTAVDLGTDIKQEVIKYSASGFRDFTRIAASDPVMWRDVFLNNRDAVLDVLQRFTEDLTALQRAIRRGEGDTLERHFTRTRAIRRGIIDAKQA